jgi:hypothetical protein
VAEAVFRAMLSEAKVTLVLGERLDWNLGVEKDGGRISGLRMESGRLFAARVFIDATYEGDLMAKAGVSYRVGRESTQDYDERTAGVHLYTGAQSPQPIDPYRKAGDASSGLLPGLKWVAGLQQGAADGLTQAYNYRLCLTQAADRVPFAKPADYNPEDYELLFRLFAMGAPAADLNPIPMPGGKSDTNSDGPAGTDWIGFSHAYPEADYAGRAQITAAHRRYTAGLLWALAHDERVPEKVRANVSSWGLAPDEFVDNDHWPYQLYVREARRMIGAYVMTEHELLGERAVEDPVALGSYRMDCHGVQRYADAKGFLRLDGGYAGGRGFPPYGVSYRALTPRESECANLLVPVCLSATHSAYGSLRMEPVYMMLGQAAGTAAALAVKAGSSVQAVPYAALRAQLKQDGLMLEWQPGAGAVAAPASAGASAKAAAAAGGLQMDESEARLTGRWRTVSSGLGVGGGYAHDENRGKGKAAAEYRLSVPEDGLYDVQIAYVPHPNRATNVPVAIETADGRVDVEVNEQAKPEIGGAFHSLGKHAFRAAKAAMITIRNDGTNGYVVIDAVRLVR